MVRLMLVTYIVFLIPVSIGQVDRRLHGAGISFASENDALNDGLSTFTTNMPFANAESNKEVHGTSSLNLPLAATLFFSVILNIYLFFKLIEQFKT